jgi:hypothetical protein
VTTDTVPVTSAGPYGTITNIGTPVFERCYAPGLEKVDIYSLTLPTGSAGNWVRAYRATDPGGPYTVTAYFSFGSFALPMPLAGLANNTTYYWEFQIGDDVSGAWAGALSTPVSFTTGNAC